MTTTVIRYGDHEEVPWKNGLGVTREVANAYRDDGSLIWHVSLATVDRDGAFSCFEDCKRILMLLSGPGMVLDFRRHGSAEVRTPFEPVLFEGGWPTTASGVTQANRVLNVVAARPYADACVAVLNVGDEGLQLGKGGTLRLFHVLSGALKADVAGETTSLERGETLRIGDSTVTGHAETADEPALVYRIDIDLAPDTPPG